MCSYSLDDSSENDNDTDWIPPQRKKKRTRAVMPDNDATNIFTLLDRTNLSCRQGAFVFNSVLQKFAPEKMKNIATSKSSIHTYRKKNRENGNILRPSTDKDAKYVLHFDSKSFKSSQRHKNEKRLALTVSFGRTEHLLGVPLLKNGMGLTAANAAYNHIQEFQLNENIIGLSFDTEPVNTGASNGACVKIEEKLNKSILNLACRHHTSEIVCGDVFEKVFDRCTTGPDEELFKEFSKTWNKFPHNQYSPCNDPRLEENQHLRGLRDQAITFILEQLEYRENFNRDDYVEILELSLLFLGADPPYDIVFRLPGAYCHSRWMGLILYTLKMYLFRDFFLLTDEELDACREFGLFVSLIYVHYWTVCTSAIDAPIHDLNFIKELKAYEIISADISETALQAIYRHLWYLGEELAPVALFSDKVTDATKNNIRLKLLDYSPNNNGRNANSIKHTILNNAELAMQPLEYFIGPSSYLLFSLLDVDISFLTLDASLWKKNDHYQSGKKAVQNLRVVNDTAERAIALATKFNLCITKDENERQLLYRKVHANRQQLPNCNKRNFM